MIYVIRSDIGYKLYQLLYYYHTISTEYEMTRELTFEDSTFSIFTTYPRISWSVARDSCINWGGNLATIKSSQQDSLLYDLADIDVYYASWIGLNDRHNEADNNPNEFVWEDGSDSNYRQFATSPSTYPRGLTVGSDCVSFRYKNLNVLSDGWNDGQCDDAVFSYYCSKPGELFNQYCFDIHIRRHARLHGPTDPTTIARVSYVID